jgi:hypothetical protein
VRAGVFAAALAADFAVFLTAFLTADFEVLAVVFAALTTPVRVAVLCFTGAFTDFAA